jgi:hypothetical protein
MCWRIAARRLCTDPEPLFSLIAHERLYARGNGALTPESINVLMQKPPGAEIISHYH